MSFQKKNKNWLSLLIVGFILLGVILVLITNKKQNSEVISTKAVVFPHYELLLNDFDTFYQSFSSYDLAVTQKIILLSPNHFYQGEIVAADHGITTHLSFIKKYFPQAEISPILLTRYVSQFDLDKLVADIGEDFKKENSILIVSTDFSHYLDADEAAAKDQETLDLILRNQSKEILKLSDDYLDCPACLYVLLKIANSIDHTISPEILFHGNSSQFFQKGEDKSFTTSYFVIKW